MNKVTPINQIVHRNTRGKQKKNRTKPRKPVMMVQALRKAGDKVKIQHFRYDKNGNLIQYSRKSRGIDIDQHGGRTVVHLTVKHPRYGCEVEAVGVSKCLDIDTYCYRDGVRHALKNALFTAEVLMETMENPAKVSG